MYRTSDRTIQISDQQELLREGRSPVGLSVVASVEGLNNFGLSSAPEGATLHEFSPSVALVLSRRLGTRAALYVVPSWVGNTRITPSAPGDEDGTLVLGLGARLRLTKTMALVGEIHPRLAGYAGDLGSGDPASLASFGVEWRVGGHAFQINFSNALGTTPAQVARGQQGTRGLAHRLQPHTEVLLMEDKMQEQKQEDRTVLETIIDRRQFTLASAMAILSGVAITITSACGGGSSPTAPTPAPTPTPVPTPAPPAAADKTAVIGSNHGHVGTITAAQLTAGGRAEPQTSRAPLPTPTRWISPRPT